MTSLILGCIYIGWFHLSTIIHSFRSQVIRCNRIQHSKLANWEAERSRLCSRPMADGAPRARTSAAAGSLTVRWWCRSGSGSRRPCWTAWGRGGSGTRPTRRQARPRRSAAGSAARSGCAPSRRTSPSRSPSPWSADAGCSLQRPAAPTTNAQQSPNSLA